jgi:tRNA (adenine37-N6)-methyltransferase
MPLGQCCGTRQFRYIPTATEGFPPALTGWRRYRFEEIMQSWSVRPIGFVRSPFSEAHQVPRGLGAKHEEEGVLEILPEFEAGLQDIEGFSHLYVLWLFDRSQGYELVGTPPCDVWPHGVFASRSPRRPNPIGLTVVRLLGRERNQLRVRGVDMLEGTPILDIKPYLSNVPEAELQRGWLAEAESRREAEKGRE